MSGTSCDGTLDLTRPGDRENYFVVRENINGVFYLLDYTMEVADGYVIKTDVDENNDWPWTTQVSRLNLTGDPANSIGTAYLVTTSYEDGRTGVTQIAPGPGGLSEISCVVGHDGTKGVPPWPDAKSLGSRM